MLLAYGCAPCVDLTPGWLERSFVKGSQPSGGHGYGGRKGSLMWRAMSLVAVAMMASGAKLTTMKDLTFLTRDGCVNTRHDGQRNVLLRRLIRPLST